MKLKFIFIIFIFSASLLLSQEINRIISLGPTSTKELYLLGLGNKIVGDTTYCNFSEDAKNKAKIGSVVNFSIEKIVALKPDIIFANSLNDPKQLSSLKRFGIKNIVMFDQPKSYKELCNQLIRMGEQTGKKDKAVGLIKKSEFQVSGIMKAVEKSHKVKVFVQIGANPLFTVTGGTFIDDIIKFAGGENIAEKDSSGIYSIEKVVEQKPEVIIVSLMGSEKDKAVDSWKKFNSIPAVAENRIYFISSDELCSPNPVTFPEVLKKVAGMLHPDLKVN